MKKKKGITGLLELFQYYNQDHDLCQTLEFKSFLDFNEINPRFDILN